MKKSTVKATKESGGIRELYADDLKDERSQYPRAKLSHPMRFYLDKRNLHRPLFAFHQLARISELFLYKTRFGREKLRQHQERAETMFIEVRRIQRNILSNYGKFTAIPRDMTPKFREMAARLFDEAVELNTILSETKPCVCPVCRGRGKVRHEDYLMVRALLEELVAQGKITRDQVPAALTF